MKQARRFWLKISCLSLDLKKNIPNPAKKDSSASQSDETTSCCGSGTSSVGHPVITASARKQKILVCELSYLVLVS